MSAVESLWSPLLWPVLYDLGSHSYVFQDQTRGTLFRVPCQVVPGNNWFHNQVGAPSNSTSPSSEGLRRFLMQRSVFDLVKDNYVLEFADQQLLGWYLSLTAEDWKIIQDNSEDNIPLQPTISSKLDKGPSFYGATLCVRCGTALPPSAKGYTRCNTPVEKLISAAEEPEFGQLPSSVNESLLFREDGNGAKKENCLGAQQRQAVKCNCNQVGNQSPTAFKDQTTEEQSRQEADKSEVLELSHLWENSLSQLKDGGKSSTVIDRDSQNQANESLEAEKYRQNGKASIVCQCLKTHWQQNNHNECEASHIPSTQPAAKHQTLSSEAAASGKSSQMEDRSSDYLLICTDWSSSVDHGATSMTGREEWEGADFHCMEKGESTLMSVTSKGQKQNRCGVHSTPVTYRNTSVARAALPPNATCDVSVGTEHNPSVCHMAATQTDRPPTADKNTLTQLQMADLENLAEKFLKLQLAQKESRKIKPNLKSSGGAARRQCGAERECECAGRAQRAELNLLALQYRMCQQHCWTCHYSSPKVDHVNQEPHCPEGPPAILLYAFQKLYWDYVEMRERILIGVPLDQLEPLSVDSQMITTGSPYTPALLTVDAVGSVINNFPWPLGQDNSADCKESKNAQGGRPTTPHPTVSQSKSASLLPKQGDCRPEDKQTGGVNKEPIFRETWYDAEESLEPAGQASSAITNKREGSSKEVEKVESSFVCVTELPKDVAEGDLMLLFEKYKATQVRLCMFNNVRAAVVTVSGPQMAEAAVVAMNGLHMQGHALHVEHIASQAGRQRQSQQQVKAANEMPGESGDTPKPKAPQRSPSNNMVKPLCSSLEKWKVVSDYPTAQGTCVPQHYATMEGLDFLVARLMERHPEAGRQAIVDVLLELRAKYKRVLVSLPLGTIVEMISKLLSRSQNTTLP